jgi:hypothetical protein
MHKRHIFTTDEVAYIRRSYGKVSLGGMARHLDLTKRQVTRKVSTLGLTKPAMERVTGWSERVLDILAETERLDANGVYVECRSRYEGGIELKAYYAEASD